MTDDNYTKIADLAISMAKLIKERSQIYYAWAPFQLLYVEMAKRKEINTLREIGNDKALLYWTEASVARPDSPKYLKIWISQALYLYDLIKSETHEKITQG